MSRLVSATLEQADIDVEPPEWERDEYGVPYRADAGGWMVTLELVLTWEDAGTIAIDRHDIGTFFTTDIDKVGTDNPEVWEALGRLDLGDIDGQTALLIGG